MSFVDKHTKEPKEIHGTLCAYNFPTMKRLDEPRFLLLCIGYYAYYRY